MDERDRTLSAFVQPWVASQPAVVEVVSATAGGPPSFVVVPKNAAALSVRLWVADTGSHVACAFGSGIWWDQAAPLSAVAVHRLLEAVAHASVGEETRTVFGRIVGRRGFIQLPNGERLVSIQSPGLPWLKWQPSVHYEPYSLAA